MTLTLIPISAGHSIDLQRAEELIDALAAVDDDCGAELDLTQCRWIHPGAGYRVGHALARLHGRSTILVAGFDDFGGDWFRRMTRTGLGMAIAAHAERLLVDGQDRLDEARDYYAARRFERPSFLSLRDLDGGGAVADETTFAQEKLRPWLSALGVQQGDIGENWRVFVDLFFEAICNIVDHAYRSPWQGQAKNCSFALAAHSTLSDRADMAGDFAGYLGRARQTDAGSKSQGWLEFVIADDGVGQAARFTQDPTVYSGAIAAEDQPLVDSLRAGATVKYRVSDTVFRGTPGYGYSDIATAAQELDAYLELRTGRRLLTMDGTTEDPQLTLHDTVLGYMPGTLLRVMLPLTSAQEELPPPEASA